MKKIKYLISFLLIILGILFSGELFILYLDNFQESYYRSSFAFDSLSQEFSEKKIINDIETAGKRNEVDYFMVDGDIKSAYHKVITVYGSENALKSLEKKGIYARSYNSIFMGKVDVHFKEFSSIDDIKTYEYCYLIADELDMEKMKLFKAELVDKYGGGFPRLYGSDRETKFNICTVWLLISSIILIMTLYDVAYQRKEIAVRIILGEDAKLILLKILLLDSTFLICSFLLILKFAYTFSNVLFFIRYVLLIYSMLILLNVLINTSILFVNFKKHITRDVGGNLLLLLNYSQKTIVSILVILIFASNIIVISQGIDYYKQSRFFDENKSYSYYILNYKVSNKEKTYVDEQIMNKMFYKMFHDRSLMYVDLSKYYSANYPIIMINLNAMNNLFSEFSTFSDIKEKVEEEGRYIILPESVDDDSIEFDYAQMNYASMFDGESINQKRIIRYKGNVEMLSIDNSINFKSSMMKKPIIIYDNLNSSIDTMSSDSFMAIAYNIMYDISDEEFDSFIERYDLNNQIKVKSNVLDVYKYNLSIASRSMKIVFLLSIFFIVLEILLITLIIRMEYRVNAVELALKKIHGYSIYERNGRLIRITIASSIISIIIGWLILTYSFNNVSTLALLVVPLLLGIELCYITYKSKMIEDQRLPLIFKGERI